MAGDKKQKLSVDDLLSELKAVKSDIIRGDFNFKELSYEQLRKVSATSASVAEIIALTRNLLTEYILQNVEFANDTVKLDNEVAITIRPFLLNILRTISIGSDYTEGGKTYTLYQVTNDDLATKIEPQTFTRDGFELEISAPTLREDIIYTTLLMNSLSGYRNKTVRNISETEAGSINELYQFYETMKYIRSFSLKGMTYTFIDLNTADKVRVLNQFPQQIISVIMKYRKQIDNLVTKAYTCYNPEDGSKIEVEQELQLFAIGLED